MVDSFTQFMERCPTDGGSVPPPYCYDYTGDDLMVDVSLFATYFVYIGIGVFAATYIYMATWVRIIAKVQTSSRASH